MTSLPTAPRLEEKTTLELALELAAAELAAQGATELDVEDHADRCRIVIAETLRKILKGKPRALRAGSLWTPRKPA